MTQEEMNDFLYNLTTWAKIIAAGLAVWLLVELFI